MGQRELASIEEKVYAGTEGLVSDFVLTKWLKEFDAAKVKAVMITHAKADPKTSIFCDCQRRGQGKGGGQDKGGRSSGKGGNITGAGEELVPV
ncbi:hypothetical protein CYMTET_8134 [Cymbomonas tetramitiformis]|uniref:Uncharacterized protein n=1 Tax=Cymbomonas tetramitiformis TaxID=36881 RepID=A0AAE0LG63_9CHLO|nr:hypothetical protein CYMTET_8134 [Cymbomonas tetramitiformis]